MKKSFIPFIPLLILLLLTPLNSCKKSSESDNDNCIDFTDFDGITNTDANGNVISEDGDDWCPAGQVGSITFGPAYPNPTGSECLIPFNVSLGTQGYIRIYNENQTLIRTLHNGTFTVNSLNPVWDLADQFGERVGPGLYRAILKVDQFCCYGDIWVLEADSSGAE